MIDFCWLLKSVQVGQSNWVLSVVRAATCPDQRKYRRLNRSERIRFEAEFKKTFHRKIISAD